MIMTIPWPPSTHIVSKPELLVPSRQNVSPWVAPRSMVTSAVTGLQATFRRLKLSVRASGDDPVPQRGCVHTRDVIGQSPLPEGLRAVLVPPRPQATRPQLEPVLPGEADCPMDVVGDPRDRARRQPDPDLRTRKCCQGL
jgi:hypothetical protein